MCLCLRWPTARETSASWLRCLAAGKPTIVPDQVTTVDVPTLDPRHWQLKHDRTDAASVFQPPEASRAVAVSIELADEEAMLRQALRRLVADARPARRRSGAGRGSGGRRHHTVARMQRDYERALAWAASQPLPDWPADAPAHLRPDPAALARTWSRPFGVEVDILGSRESGVGSRSRLVGPARRVGPSASPQIRQRAMPNVTIQLNGETYEVPEPLTVDALLARLEIDGRRVAVEVNELVVRKAAYADTVVRDGDAVEVVNFVGGG